MPKPEERPAARPHDLILESRTILTVTGVQKVLHCSPESAALETGKGTLHLAGAQLSVVSLDLEAGEAKLTGRFDALEYTRTAAAGASGTGFCADAAGAAARPVGAGAGRLHHTGCSRGCGTGVFPGAGTGCLCAGCPAHRGGAVRRAELCCRPQQCRGAALVHGAGGLCRSPLHGSRAGHSGAVGRAVSGVGAGCSGAPCPAMGAAAAGAAARGTPRSTQRTPERKKNRKKSEKELAKPAPCVV